MCPVPKKFHQPKWPNRQAKPQESRNKSTKCSKLQISSSRILALAFLELAKCFKLIMLN